MQRFGNNYPSHFFHPQIPYSFPSPPPPFLRHFNHPENIQCKHYLTTTLFKFYNNINFWCIWNLLKTKNTLYFPSCSVELSRNRALAISGNLKKLQRLLVSILSNNFIFKSSLSGNMNYISKIKYI